jgi:CheY-like chemotaxis protein
MQTWKILLADDDPEDRAIIQDAMEENNQMGIIRFAEDGEVVLSILEQCLHTMPLPCLIILDLNMPKLNGTQTLSRIKNDERFKHIKVIMYSTSINPLEKEKCMQLGAYDYITKPITFTEGMTTAKFFLQCCNTLAIS